MALCTITGFVYMPNGQPAADRLFKFKPSRKGIVADYFGAVVPEVIEATTNELGFLTVELLTGNYVAFSALYNGPVTVPDAEEASLYEVFGGTGSVTPPAIAPNFTVLPSLLGSTSLGGTITVNLGAATGSPEPAITGTLTRPGAAPVAVTQGQLITVQAGDQGGSLSLTATATSSAGVDTETVSRAIPAAIPAPVFTTPLPDVVLTVGDAPVVTDLTQYTANAAIYSVSPTGQGVSISGSTLTIFTAAERNGTYTVTASNSTGQTVSDAFALVVGFEEPVPPADFLGRAQSLLVQASDGANTDVTYIISGDSTRDNSYNQMISYYTYQFAKAGVVVVDNASSGQSAKDWASSADQTTLQQAIDATVGTGMNTILEYSFGINDYNGVNTREQVKTWIRDGVVSYRSAKPDASVVLVVPVFTGNSVRNNDLQLIYQELSAELSLPLIDTLDAMSSVHANSVYYQDAIHPNRNGSIRLVNYILDQLVPPALYPVITMDSAFLIGTPPEQGNMSTDIVAGSYYSTSTGGVVSNASWRRMLPIAVEPNFTLRVYHGGNRFTAAFMDETGAFISATSSVAVAGQSYRNLAIPMGAFEARINVSSEGTDYDSRNVVPIITYDVSNVPLTMEQINTGLNLRLEYAT